MLGQLAQRPDGHAHALGDGLHHARRLLVDRVEFFAAQHARGKGLPELRERPSRPRCAGARQGNRLPDGVGHGQRLALLAPHRLERGCQPGVERYGFLQRCPVALCDLEQLGVGAVELLLRSHRQRQPRLQLAELVGHGNNLLHAKAQSQRGPHAAQSVTDLGGLVAQTRHAGADLLALLAQARQAAPDRLESAARLVDGTDQKL